MFDMGSPPDAHLLDTSTTPAPDVSNDGGGWPKVEAEIMQRNAPTHQIATVWHPGARGDVVTTEHGNVRVLIGDTAEYQLSTGEKIAL
ncbi:hypothetical protein DBV14_09535 [Variovorax sp. KBW07]|nr:hypothetical protein DBV14_09535 [Variovorax sp. KBW07]